MESVSIAKGVPKANEFGRQFSREVKESALEETKQELKKMRTALSSWEPVQQDKM